jgi:hypothetical protein
MILIRADFPTRRGMGAASSHSMRTDGAFEGRGTRLDETSVVWCAALGRTLTGDVFESIHELARGVCSSREARIFLLPIERVSAIQRLLRGITRKVHGWSGLTNYLIPLSRENLDQVRRDFAEFPKLDPFQMETSESHAELHGPAFIVSCLSDRNVPWFCGLSTIGLPPRHLGFPPMGFRKILLPVLSPEASEKFFLAALSYARSWGLDLTLFMKSELVLEVAGYEKAAFGSPSMVLREQQRMALVSEWVYYAAELGASVNLHVDRSGAPFHRAIVDKVKRDSFDLLLLENELSSSFFWRRSLEKLLAKSPVPVWLATPDSLNRHELKVGNEVSVLVAS